MHTNSLLQACTQKPLAATTLVPVALSMTDDDSVLRYQSILARCRHTVMEGQESHCHKNSIQISCTPLLLLFFFFSLILLWRQELNTQREREEEGRGGGGGCQEANESQGCIAIDCGHSQASATSKEEKLLQKDKVAEVGAQQHEAVFL